MKGRLLSVVCLLVTAVLMLGWAVVAQAETPPVDSAFPSDTASPRTTTESQVSGADLGALEIPPLGASGLSYRHVATFGTPDSPYFEDTAHLNGPNALGTDGTDVWITEAYGLRALKFDQNGVFQQKIGAAGRAFNVGDSTTYVEWQHLSDVTIDASRNVWVADESRNSITKFGPDGKFLAKFGSGHGTGNYNFQQPSGIAFGPTGYMYVGDRNNHRVQIFDATGTYAATLGTTGTLGTGDYQFKNPWHVAVGTDSRLYVADSQNYRVQIFDVSTPASPIYVGTLGTTGDWHTNNSGFGVVEGVAVDASRIYVADPWNNRVQIYSRTTLAYQATIGASAPDRGSANSQFSASNDIAVDSNGNVYVSDFFNSRVQKFSPSLAYSTTIGTSVVPYLTDNTHYFRPTGVAVAADGSYYVVEEQGQRLIKRDATGAEVWHIGSPGVFVWDNQHFRLPTGVAVDAVGRVLVADSGNNRVQVYNSSGSHVKTLGTGWGTGNYQFNSPSGIGIDAAGDIYVADKWNQRVQIFSGDYEYKGTIGQTGTRGSGDNQFNNPIGVAVDSAGTIYVADPQNRRVQVFDATTYEYLRTIGLTGNGNCGWYPRDFGRLCNPASVAVDAEKRVYVGNDSGGVQVFDSSGAYLASVGSGFAGQADQLRNSSGLAIDRSGNLWVADRGYARVQKYARGVPGWVQSNLNGFGDSNQVQVISLTQFGSQLYAGTNATNGNAAKIWRTTDGRTWSHASPPWSAGLTESVVDIKPFGGSLYAGTANPTAGAEIWRTDDGAAWTRVVSGGFGSLQNTRIDALGVFGDMLYAVTHNTGGGLQIWRSATGSLGEWQRVNSEVFGTTGINFEKTLHVLGGQLYLGLARGNPLTAELWRSGDGVTWAPVFTNGRTNPSNTWVSAMAEFGGNYYLGIRNMADGGEVWRSTDGTNWVPVITGGNGDVNSRRPYALIVADNRLYLGLGNDVTGSEVWRSANGTTWQRIAEKGWGDSSNGQVGYFDKAAAVFGDRVYFGTANNTKGGQVWGYQFLWNTYLPLVVRP